MKLAVTESNRITQLAILEGNLLHTFIETHRQTNSNFINIDATSEQ